MRAARLAALLLAAAAAVVALAAYSGLVGEVRVGYEVAPPPSMEPPVVELDLGRLPSGSSGSKDFGTVATLTVPARYAVGFELEAPAEDFEELAVGIELCGERGCHRLVLTLASPSGSVVLDEGTYGLAVEVSYVARSVTSAREGAVVVRCAWSG